MGAQTPLCSAAREAGWRAGRASGPQPQMRRRHRGAGDCVRTRFRMLDAQPRQERVYRRKNSVPTQGQAHGGHGAGGHRLHSHPVSRVKTSGVDSSCFRLVAGTCPAHGADPEPLATHAFLTNSCELCLDAQKWHPLPFRGTCRGRARQGLRGRPSRQTGSRGSAVGRLLAGSGPRSVLRGQWGRWCKSTHLI